MLRSADPRFVAARLALLGFLPHARAGRHPHALASAVRTYQAFHGLDPNGRACSATERHLCQPRFCGHPDVLPVTAEPLTGWPTSKLKVTLAGTLAGFSHTQLVDIAMAAWGEWSKVADLQFEYAADVNDANIVMGVGQIDGSGKTLAWSELPQKGRRQLGQKYDTGERWVSAEHPRAQEIDVYRVIVHEGGHALGLPHLSGEGDAIMNAMYNPQIRRPTAKDVKAMRELYPAGPTDPDLPPLPTGGTVVKFPRPVSAVEVRAA